MERKDHLVGINGCEHSWPCFGKPAIIFHDRGKIFTSERARQVLVDRLGIITEQAPRTRHPQKEPSNRFSGG
ncbi:hypothetical protein EPA93_14870 [Ktedonosporobacter rubrisoli]|uniref:Uncharacterized protein n=1 Tax=Ktedonosporobacter rubrisoli TaxID=2509675 RepID=A0A4P6JPB1_KTERU|nr:hypothetical protein [Ktedonosporobacter rubrisoli]QBD77208.1 hypothetical protein EPA93_14870 [Ktedonosporobacter rubrisoli]